MKAFYVKVLGSIVAVGIASCPILADSVTLSPIFVSIGPNPNTPSPSYAGYTYSAQAGVSAGGVNVGGNIKSTPSAYNVLGSSESTVSLQSIVGTPFPSWLGAADPSGPLASESGNCIFWSLEIVGAQDQNSISLNQLNFAQSSTDPLNYFGIKGSYASFAYSPDALGILADGEQISSGSPNQDVNRIVVTGFGGYLDGDPAVTGYQLTGNDSADLQAIDNIYASALGNFSIDTCFTYGAASTCGTVNVVDTVDTPEPSSVIELILGLSLLSFGCLRRHFQV